MTKKEAKKLSLEVWRYLRDHPKLTSKLFLPYSILQKIMDLSGRCPLCSVFKNECSICILGRCTTEENNGIYDKWMNARNKKTRAKYASIMVKKIEKWKV